MFLSRTYCREITHADGYDGVWPGWAVSGSVAPLTEACGKLYTCSDTRTRLMSLAELLVMHCP